MQTTPSSPSTVATERRGPTIGLWIVATLLVAGSLNALWQISNEIRDPEPGSLILSVLQACTAISAMLAAIAVVRRHQWAPHAIAIWGAIAAAMVVLLEPIGFVEASDRAGLWQGAAVIVTVAAAMCWYVRRRIIARSTISP